MKIIDNMGTTKFDNLKVKDVFKYKEYIGMKTEELYEDGEIINAVDLVTGSFLVLYGTEIVIPVDATLTITIKEN